MGGFADRDARVTSATATATDVDVCTVRTGLLVMEVERVVVNEYPHHDPTSPHAQQPLLVRSITSDKQAESEGDVQAWVSPLRYRAGETVASFEALRVVERPMRAIRAKRFVLRLAENDRTSAASWNRAADVAGGAAGAGGVLGVPMLPSEIAQEGVRLLAKLDRDDLILLWSIDADTLVKGFGGADVQGSASRAKALRFALATPRRAPDGKSPAATADVVVFRQPEPGCP
jgi:hypothetical protein